MKAILPIIPVIALISGLQADEAAPKATSKHFANIVDIEAKFQPTPNFQARGPGAKEVDPRTWLEIEAELELKTIDPSGYIPQLEANWYAIVYEEDPKTKQKKPVQLTGTSVFKDIRVRKDGKAFISAYIEPKTLEHYFGDNRMSVRRDFQAFAVTLSGKDLFIDKKTGQGPFMATDKQETKWWSNWKDNYVSDSIVAKSKTPFKLMWLDRYPTEQKEE